jgi:hypothetical protein
LEPTSATSRKILFVTLKRISKTEVRREIARMISLALVPATGHPEARVPRLDERKEGV